MDSSHAMMRSTSFATRVLPIAFILFLLASVLVVDPSIAFTVQEGIVEYASGPAVTVRGKTYQIGSARIIAPSGKELPLSEIYRGKKVDLHIVNGKVTEVVVYPAMME